MEQKVIKLTEADLQRMVVEAVENIMGEKKFNKQSVIRKLYNIVHENAKGRFHDTGWQGIDHVLKAIEDAGFDVSVSVKNGGYRNSKGGNTLFLGDNTVSYWKEFDLEIPVGDKVIYGRLQANGCGTTEDPFDYYDVTCSFW